MGWREEADGSVLWEDPGTAVGWLERSALPGEGTNVVLAGHHNIRGEVFRYLVDVAPGDEVYLAAGETTYRYLVRERFIVPEKHVSEEQRAQNALWIAPTIDERLTLVTCWPYRDNSHRLIVIAAPPLWRRPPRGGLERKAPSKDLLQKTYLPPLAAFTLNILFCLFHIPAFTFFFTATSRQLY